jgi:endonuclease YncB( thermonuclease family)
MTKAYRYIQVAIILLLPSVNALAAIGGFDEPNTENMSVCGKSSKLEAASGDSLVDDTGQIYRLAGVKAPEIWDADSDYKSWPYSVEAQQALSNLTAQHSVTFYCEKKSKDRKGAFTAHAVRADDLWLQAELLKAGSVFYLPLPETEIGLEDLRHFETQARTEKRGLWAFDSYQTMPANDLETLKGRFGYFSIVQGKVHDIAKVGDTIFINFDEDWRSDFTIEVSNRTARLFEKAGRDLFEIEGKAIEVRGWLDQKGGPRILLLAPSHLTLLDRGQ